MDRFRSLRTVFRVWRGPVKPERFDQTAQFARCQITPASERNAADRERTDAHTPQPFNRNFRRFHQTSHDMGHAFVEIDAQPNAVRFFTQKTNLVGHDQLAVERHTVSQPLECRVRWSLCGENVIFLGQPEAGVHDAIGDLPIVRQQQEPFGRAV